MIILTLFIVCFTGLILTAIALLKQVQGILYTDGRSFGSLDLTFAWKKGFLNRRINRLSDESKEKVRKWLYLDFVFMPCLYISTAILSWWTSTVFETGFFHYLLQVLILGQGISWLCDIYENLTLLRLLKNPDATLNMFIYDLAVCIKFLFPTLAVILLIAALILKWSRFLHVLVNDSAAVFFLLPGLAICLAVAVTIFINKKQETVEADQVNM